MKNTKRFALKKTKSGEFRPQVTSELPWDLFIGFETYRKKQGYSRAEAIRSIIEEYIEIYEELKDLDKGMTYVRSQTTGEAMRLPEDVAEEWLEDPEFVKCTRVYYLGHST